MTNKSLGIGLLATVSIAFLLGFAGIETSGEVIFLIGLFTMFFGIWGGLRLIKGN